jgi:hypothetical protein
MQVYDCLEQPSLFVICDGHIGQPIGFSSRSKRRIIRRLSSIFDFFTTSVMGVSSESRDVSHEGLKLVTDITHTYVY